MAPTLPRWQVENVTRKKFLAFASPDANTSWRQQHDTLSVLPVRRHIVHSVPSMKRYISATPQQSAAPAKQLKMSTLDVPSSDTAIDTTPYVDFWPSYLPFDEAQALYAQLRDSCSWAQGIVSIAGKQYNERRLSVVMGRHPGAYKYSSRRVTVEPLSPVVADLMERVSAHCGLGLTVSHIQKKSHSGEIILLTCQGEIIK